VIFLEKKFSAVLFRNEDIGPPTKALNRKFPVFQKSGPPPPPPVRSVSLLNGSVTPTKDDSGRDSDPEFHRPERRLKTSLDLAAGDEGFCSSHEDHHNVSNNNNVNKAVYDSYLESVGLNTKSVVSPSRQLTNHRAVQVPILPKVTNIVFLKKEVARDGERTRVLSISFIFSFSPLYH
jgi:hypothetical protein